jgi:hypothetical protein
MLPLVAVLTLAGVSLSACDPGNDHNTDASDNCSAVLVQAVAAGYIPDIGWTLWDSTSVVDAYKADYRCRALTLSLGGEFVLFNIQDRDTLLPNGDGYYAVTGGPTYSTQRFDLGGTADFCSGHHVPWVFGHDCSWYE